MRIRKVEPYQLVLKGSRNFSEALEAMQIKVKIRIHKSIMDRVLDYCSYEDFMSDGDSYYIVDFPFIENDYYYDILLGFGDKCECLEPPHIRKNLKCRIHSIAAIYKNKSPTGY